MSRNDVEIVQRGYEAFNRGDTEAMVVDVAPTFEYEAMGRIPGFPSRFKGPDGWKNALSWVADEFDSARVEILELIDADNKVLASVNLHARGRQSGVETKWHIWNLWTVRDGQIVGGRGFPTREQAFEAAGRTE